MTSPATSFAEAPSALPMVAELAGSLAERPRTVTLSGAPEGHDAAVIGGLIGAGAAPSWIHVCRDDGRMARFAAGLAFFHPELESLSFPEVAARLGRSLDSVEKLWVRGLAQLRRSMGAIV